MNATTESLPPSSTHRYQQPRGRRALLLVGRHSVLIGLALMFALPLVFMVLQSLMPITQAKTTALWPHSIEWGNYRTVFDRIPLATYFVNTLKVCVVATIGTVVSCVPVAYAFSHLRWRGRTAVFVLVLSTMMLPYQVLFVSQYEIFTSLGWINSILPLTVPAFFADAFSIFLLRQFFLTLPTEVMDAARIDGASEFGVLARVVVPMARPGIMAVALFQFLFSWSDFFGPNIYLADEKSLTLAVGLVRFNTALAKTGESNLTMAASVVFVLPILVVFFFAQKVFIEGVTLTGTKG
ncbi:MAG: carbohydrate ABC transporter permease [Ilumatobacteraceae bacterium]|nr:carbohydrate ABC transporter permease [Ilumatobacteraceae bacterium]